jgi:hypothetical protein
MDQEIINILIGSVLAVLGWFARQLWDAVQALKEDMKQIEFDMPTNYVRKDEMESRFDKIELLLSRIYEKLDMKADK